MPIRPTIAIIAGALASVAVGFAATASEDGALVSRLEREAAHAIAEAGGEPIRAVLRDRLGYPTRHALLTGGETIDEGTRDRVAKAVAAIPGMGGVRWSDGTMVAQAGEIPLSPLHCEEDVDALLRARTIRFEEGSSAIDPASSELLDEVAAALRPCLGSIIAITGHTDATGPEPGNIALSRERAIAVRSALMDRGIPRDGLRARGVGSREPVEGLLPDDPANRRIEFEVVATTPIQPTPIDVPGPR